MCDGHVKPPPAGARVSGALRAIVLRGLSVAPGDRFPTMDALIVELGRDRAKPVAAHRDRRGRARRRARLGLVADWAGPRARSPARSASRSRSPGNQLASAAERLRECVRARSRAPPITSRALREVTGHHDQADFGLGTPEADLQDLERLHNTLASGRVGQARRSDVAIADYKGRLLYTSAAPATWDTDLKVLPTVKRALDRGGGDSITVCRTRAGARRDRHARASARNAGSPMLFERTVALGDKRARQRGARAVLRAAGRQAVARLDLDSTSRRAARARRARRHVDRRHADRADRRRAGQPRHRAGPRSAATSTRSQTRDLPGLTGAPIGKVVMARQIAGVLSLFPGARSGVRGRRCSSRSRLAGFSAARARRITGARTRDLTRSSKHEPARQFTPVVVNSRPRPGRKRRKSCEARGLRPLRTVRPGHRSSPIATRSSRCSGAGGMGEVYRARHLERSGKKLALKVLVARVSTDFEARFEREARALARLDHPSCVRVLDYGRSERPCTTSRWSCVDGETLAHELRARAAVDRARACTSRAVCSRALAHAHAHGVLHRDVKPENVMLVGARPVLIDFGLARARATMPRLTGAGHVRRLAVVPRARAPARPAARRAHRSLRGRRDPLRDAGRHAAVRGRLAEETMHRALHRPPRPLRAIRRDVPRALDADRPAARSRRIRRAGSRPPRTWRSRSPTCRCSRSVREVRARARGGGLDRGDRDVPLAPVVAARVELAALRRVAVGTTLMSWPAGPRSIAHRATLRDCFGRRGSRRGYGGPHEDPRPRRARGGLRPGAPRSRREGLRLPVLTEPPPNPPPGEVAYAVNQQSEQIIFEAEPGWVTAHVLIRYAGDPAQFAWLGAGARGARARDRSDLRRSACSTT